MLRFLLFASLVAATPMVSAETLLKPLPQPDLSALPVEAAAALRQQRADFDAARATLVGPPLAAAFGLMGGLYARHGVFEPARIAFDNAVALTPEDFRMVYLSALVALAAQDLVGARERLERALVLQPEYPATRVHLAGVMARLGAHEAAERQYGEVVAAEVNAATAHLRLGLAAMEQGRFEVARDQFAAALSADPEATTVYFQLAAAERALGREEAASAAEARGGRGPVSLVDPLGRALFGPPEDPLEGVVALIAEGALDKARAALVAYTEAASGDIRAVALLARVEAGLGQFDAAREQVARALSKAPEGVLALVAAGVVEEMAGAEGRALEYYNRAVDSDGEHSEARLMLADALMRQRRYIAAAEHYRVLAAQDGERAFGLQRLVAAQVMAGRCADALDVAARAREGYPRDGVRAEIWARLAASCPAASHSDRERAMQLADAVYQQVPDAASSEAAAMAAASLERWEDAQDLQRQALFELAKQDDRAGIERSRALLDRFLAEQKAELPWPAGHPLYAPVSLRQQER